MASAGSRLANRGAASTTGARTSTPVGELSRGQIPSFSLNVGREDRSPVAADDVGAAAAPVVTWLVDDDVAPGDGQLQRRVFLAALAEEIHASGDKALAPVGRTTEDCIYIRRLLAQVASMPAASIELLLRAHAAPDAASASDYLRAVGVRIADGVAYWIATGRIPDDVPDEQTLVTVGASSGEGEGEPGLFFARAAAGDAAVAPPIADPAALRAYLGAGAPIPPPVRQSLEDGFGQDLGGVRVHDGAAAGRLADQLSAHAVTVGNDIAFAPGAYAPQSGFGQALLAHEVAHTLQQRGAQGPIVGFGDASHERDADDAARDALARAHGGKERGRPGLVGGLRLQRCGKGGTSEKDAGPAPTVPAPKAPAPPDPAKVALEAVKSPSIADYRGREKDNFAAALTRLERRTSQIDEIVKLTKAADTEKLETLARMKSRWAGTILTQSGFDSVSGEVKAETAKELRAKLAEDKADATQIGNAGLTEWVAKLTTSLTSYLNQHRQVSEETVEFQRFNDHFLDPDVIAALQSTAADFRPADLKAMLAKETGDFTNITVVGLEGKTKGIVTDKKNVKGPSYIGVAQMDTGAKTDALKAAKTLGIAAPADPASGDAREDPAKAVKLAALYVAYIAKFLKDELPGWGTLSSIERKKFILAAYNGGIGAIKKVVIAHGKKSSYGWQEVADDQEAMKVGWKDEGKPTEVKDYVRLIMERAP
jgi:hypothetical protein